MNSAGVTGSISARRRFSVSRWIRASSRRSHHSSSLDPGVNEPRSTMPSDSSVRRAACVSPAERPNGAPRAAAVTGPSSASRPRSSSTIASSRVQVLARRVSGAAIAGIIRSGGDDLQFRQALGRHPNRLWPCRVGGECGTTALRRALRATPTRREGVRPLPAVRKPAVTSASCSSSASRGSGRTSSMTTLDRARVEDAESAVRRRIGGAPRHHGLRPPLLERRIVDELVRPRVEDLVRERRGLGRVAGDAPNRSVVDPLQDRRGAPAGPSLLPGNHAPSG